MPLVPIPRRAAPVRAAVTRVHQVVNVPAPVGGLNYRDPISSMAMTEATVLQNLIVRPVGLELRPGYKKHATGLGGAIGTLMPYVGETLAQRKLFAVVGTSIYDVTSSGTGPWTPALTVPSASSDGIWHWTMFTTSARAFLCAVNNGGGFWTYDSVGGWIERTPTGTWPGTKTIVSICAWKNRLWFAFDASATAQYLPVNSISGVAAQKTFASQLRHGGSVAAIANLTHDAGVGVDDYQVVFGSQGDVIVYQGYDPDTADNYQLKGIWSIGHVPVGGRFYTSYGGDLYALSDMGIVPISQLINGRFGQTSWASPVTGKIQPVLSPFLSRTRDLSTWEVHVIPKLDVLLLKAPKNSSVWSHFAMGITSGAWSRFPGIPMNTAVMFDGDAYFADDDGAVYYAFDSAQDTDNAGVDGTGGTTLEGIVQTAFGRYSDGGAALSRYLMCRPVLVARQAPSVKVTMNSEYVFTDYSGSPAFVGPDIATWDAGVWDTAKWAGEGNTYASWVGLRGTGFLGALRLGIRGLAGTVWASAQVMTEPGGVL